MTDLPAEAVEAAAVAIHRLTCPDGGCDQRAYPEDIRSATAALEAAAPAIRQQERQSLFGVQPDREAAFDQWFAELISATGNNLSQAEPDGLAHEAYCQGWDTERDRIITLASQLHATIPADHPKGAQASFADYLRVTSPAEPKPAHAVPHFRHHPLAGNDWCQCPCPECYGHVEGLEGMDCICPGCGCHANLLDPAEPIGADAEPGETGSVFTTDGDDHEETITP